MRKYVFIILILSAAVISYAAVGFLERNRVTTVNSGSGWINAKPDLTQLRSGDLIFRHGRGIISAALMSMSRREKKYSHAGIISVEKGKVFVYHAIGGEGNDSNKLRKDPIGVFCSPERNHAFGIYRAALDAGEINKIVSLADKYFKNGLLFDTKFDLSTDDKMYCTEFIYKIFQQVPGMENCISLSAVRGKQYITCDDVYLNPHFTGIYQYSY